MSAPTISTLYGLYVDGDPYHSAKIVLCTSALPAGVKLTLADLGEPTVQGYQRQEGPTLEDLFHQRATRPGEWARFTSRPMEWTNESSTMVQLTGIALLVYADAFTPIVVAAVPALAVWRPGRRIVARMFVTSNIYVQGP